jgi:hypothetical protein
VRAKVAIAGKNISTIGANCFTGAFSPDFTPATFFIGAKVK